MATETHIAGVDIHWDGRYIQQRCSWCGAVLVAVDTNRIAFSIEPGDDPDVPRPFPVWPVGALVRCSYDGEVARWGEVALSRTVKEVVEPEEIPEHPGSVKLPPDACVHALPIEGD